MDTHTIPFFVYGTLKPGFPNDYVWENRAVHAEYAAIPNAYLRNVQDRFPAMFPGGNEAVQGVLVYVHPETVQAVTAAMDRIEHFVAPGDRDNLYHRELVRVWTETAGWVTAWTYWAGTDLDRAAAPDRFDHWD